MNEVSTGDPMRGYVIRDYVRAPGERWRRSKVANAEPDLSKARIGRVPAGGGRRRSPSLSRPIAGCRLPAMPPATDRTPHALASRRTRSRRFRAVPALSGRGARPTGPGCGRSRT